MTPMMKPQRTQNRKGSPSIRPLELAYDTTFAETIRASITPPISASIALARVGKSDDGEAKSF